MIADHGLSFVSQDMSDEQMEDILVDLEAPSDEDSVSGDGAVSDDDDEDSDSTGNDSDENDVPTPRAKKRKVVAEGAEDSLENEAEVLLKNSLPKKSIETTYGASVRYTFRQLLQNIYISLYLGVEAYEPLRLLPTARTVPAAKRRNEEKCDGFQSIPEDFAWIDDAPFEYDYKSIDDLPFVPDGPEKKVYDFTGMSFVCMFTFKVSRKRTYSAHHCRYRQKSERDISSVLQRVDKPLGGLHE